MPFRSFLCVLLITVALPTCAFASMLDPEADQVTTDTSNTNSSTSLKQKLEAARRAAGTPEIVAAAPLQIPVTQKVPPLVATTPIAPVPTMATIAPTAAPIYQAPVPVAIPVAVPEVAKREIITTPAAHVQQQVIRFDNTVAAAPSSDMHDLLFDDAVEKPSTPNASMLTGNVEAMPAAPVIPVQNDYIPAAAPAPIPAYVPAPAPKIASAPIPSLAPAPSLTDAPFEKPLPHYHTSVASAAPAAAAMTAPAPLPSVYSNTEAPKPPKKTYVTAVEIRKAVTASSSRFKPMPSKAVSDWAIRNIDSTSREKNDGLCLLQNRFDNNLTLVIGQGADGTSMLAINYGIDMLQANYPYTAKVELDESYSKDFTAYADGPQRLIIKLGNNSDFFAALQSADALHVAIRGASSTFAVNTLSQGLQNFAQCVKGIGGNLPSAAQKQMPAVSQIAMPAVPVAPVIQENIVPTNSAPQPQQTSYQPNQQGYWIDNTYNTMKQAGFQPYGLQKSANMMQWTNNNNTLHASARQVPVSDIIDASSLLMDSAEKACGGKFASQMGLPENNGNTPFIQMESKCIAPTGIMVSTWAVVKQGDTVTAWQMESPRDERGIAFDARQQILNAVTR